MSGCRGERRGTDRYRCLKDLQDGFRKLKQKEKNNSYRAGDTDCQEVAKKLITDLRELTDSGLDEVLTFGITERGIVNRLEKDLKSSNEAYQKKAKELETEKINHKESKERLEQKVKQLEEELQQQKDEIKGIKSELEEHEKANRILEKDNKGLTNERERIQTELENCEDKRRNKEDENKTLLDRMMKLESELQDVNDAKKNLENENKRLNETTQRQREKDIDEIKTLNSALGKLEDEKKKLETDKTRLSETTQRQREKDIDEIQTLNSALGKLEDEKKKLETDKTRFKKESEQWRKKLGEAEQNQRDLIIALNRREQDASHLETQIRTLQHEYNQVISNIQTQRNTIDKLQKNLSEEKKAKEHALNRLSAAAAHRLRDQNPGITDLSDPNRPLKLAEKVSELYDNEWTNAMENLEKLEIQEEKGIKILLKIIKNVFDTCVDFGDTHLESFPDLLALPPVIYQLQKERVLSVKEMSSEMLKPMKDFRKSNAEHAISRLQKYIAAERKSKLKIKQKVYDSCKEYIEKCVELCWMMRIQDPPIYMEAGYQTNSAFDSNKMRSYTKAGKFVRFVVWPTFFLHRDGPLLAKGVVQGSKLEIAEEESSHLSDDGTDDEFLDALSTNSPFNENKSDDVADGSQSNRGNADDKVIDDSNRAPFDAKHLENEDKEGKGEDESCPDLKQSNQRNGKLSKDKRNTPIKTTCSETDDKGENEDVPQITESDPEKDKLPNDNSNASDGNDSSNVEDSDVPDGKKSGLDNGMQSNTSLGTESSDIEDKKGDLSRTSGEKGAGSNKKATDDPTFTDDQEIDS